MNINSLIILAISIILLRKRGLRLTSTAALSIILVGLAGQVSGSAASLERRMLFDDYYQKARPDNKFPQGVARGDAKLRDLTNFYSPAATAIPNGTFVFSELIADKFKIEISRQPLSSELLQGVAAYLLICPAGRAHGGRANLTENEAAILEEFVAQGGSLILIANSISEPGKEGFDLVGLNLIAQKFGVRFLARQTDTISIPIPNDHALFDGVRDIIYGNGTTLEILPSAEPATQILLESHSPRALGPVAVLATHRKGKVLVIGDAGSFGNAHIFRSDIGQAQGLQQMIYGLLPDGPVPRYGWHEGMQLKVHLKQEQIISGYPEFMQIFDLPRPAGTKVYSSMMRDIDLAAAGAPSIGFGRRDFVSAVSLREAVLDLVIGSSDSRSFKISWRDAQGSLPAKLLPSGRLIAPGIPIGDELIAWQSVLLNDVVCAPLKAYAQPGDKWWAEGMAGLPQAQLTMSPRLVPILSHYKFEGESTYEGKECYLFSRVTRLEGKNWTPSDLIGTEYAMQFHAHEIEIQAGGQLAIAKYWIGKASLLPVHTEITVSAAFWWRDPRFPAKYIGTHDSKNYENWAFINLNATYGRKLTVDFELK